MEARPPGREIGRRNLNGPRFDKNETLRIELLGGFRVLVESRVIEEDEWRLRSARRLVKLLALDPGHALQRHRILDVLWPDLGPEAASNNLHHALHVARRALKVDTRYLRLDDDRLSLNPEGLVWTDVGAFESAAKMARSNRDPGAYRAALGRYTGELLPGDLYEDWAEEERARLQNTYQELLYELARLYEMRGEFDEAVDTLRRLVAEVPEHEEAHTGLMRLYAASGERYQALQQYKRLESTLRDKLDAEPTAAIRHLYGELLAGRAPVITPLVSTESSVRNQYNARHNLPAPLSSFVGREEEVSEVLRLLSENRLLTLTGSGGCGKTRLSLAAAGALVNQYPDGVWLVELSQLAGPGAVTQAVAAAVGEHEQIGRPLLNTVLDKLRQKKTLIVLDNCEHLVYDAARLAETLLRACPGLRVLATSREILGVRGETSYVVHPLSVPDLPDAGSSPGVEEAEKFDSVRLFMERARERRTGLELTEDNVRDVTEICRRLDGIPLAIELAAARTGLLSVAQISTRLDALDLLTEGGRTAESRQRTLRGAVDWSYELLERAEQQLFRRLSVFAGGFTLEAAEAVTSDAETERTQVLDLLGKLRDKSLVSVLVSDEVRYRLLEPIRLYALERLEQDDDAEQARRRYAEWCLEFAEEAKSGLAGHDQARWLNRLEVEHANLRAALGWTLDGEGTDKARLGLRISAALWLFWDARGHLIEGREWLLKALRESEEGDTSARARALNAAGWLSITRAEYDAAIPLLEESITIYRELEDEEGLAATLANLGFAAMFGMRQDVDLPALLEEAQHLKTRIEDQRTLGMLLIFSGFLMEAPEAGQHGEPLHEESLDLFRKVRDVWGTSTCLTSLGVMALQRRDHARAAESFKENLDISRPLDKKVCISYSFFGLGSLAADRESHERAVRLWAASEQVREAGGIKLSPMARHAVGYDAQIAAARAELEDHRFETAWAEGRAMSQEEAIEYALETRELPTAEQPPPDLTLLTRREREVADLVGQGLTNYEVSKHLVISKRTAENHASRILKKLGLDNREDLRRWMSAHQAD